MTDTVLLYPHCKRTGDVTILNSAIHMPFVVLRMITQIQAQHSNSSITPSLNQPAYLNKQIIASGNGLVKWHAIVQTNDNRVNRRKYASPGLSE